MCIVDFIRDLQELESFDQLIEVIEYNNGFNIEIMYYNRAIEYLQKNDPSLKFSLEIASDIGFDIKNLSSEVLASLLASENEKAAFYDLQAEIESFIEELNS